MDGLGEDFKVVSLRVGLVEKISGGSLPGEKQDLDGRQQGTDADGRVDSVQVVHHDVRDEHVGPKCERNFEGFLAGVNRAGKKSALVEDHCQGVGNYGLIVYDEDFGLRGWIGHKLLSMRFNEALQRALGFAAFSIPGQMSVLFRRFFNDTLRSRTGGALWALPSTFESSFYLIATPQF